ncbi:MAG: Gfo/Idh/MocA family oxidoreductase [Rhodobacter sp.]|nr:Gfo/Idh/MocA family oxidoreductase [Rhodobacter sp.]
MPDTKRFAVVGFGLIGQRHADVLPRSPGLTLAAAVDAREASRRASTDLGARSLASLDDLFDPMTPDGIVLAASTPMHVEPGLACVARGCPVLIKNLIAATAIAIGMLCALILLSDVGTPIGYSILLASVVDLAFPAVLSVARLAMMPMPEVVLWLPRAFGYQG